MFKPLKGVFAKNEREAYVEKLSMVIATISYFYLLRL